MNRNPRGGGGGYSGRSNIRDIDRTERDDRFRAQRRVTFKNHGRSDKNNDFNKRKPANRAIAEMAIKSLFQDDDVMNDQNSAGNSSYNQHDDRTRRRRGSPIPKSRFNQAEGASNRIKTFSPSPIGWYQVNIPYGSKYNREELFRILIDAVSPEIFVPRYMREENKTLIFYVDNTQLSDKLSLTSNKIQMKDGFRLKIHVRHGIPPLNIDENFKELLKVVMSKRFNIITKALDLSNLNADSSFQNTFCPLFRPQVQALILEIITTNIPDLEALNLNNNKILNFDGFREISKKVSNLKILYLAENRINSMGALMIFKDLPLIEMVLSGNPIQNRYKSEAAFLIDIKKKFPNLNKLDDKMLGSLSSSDLTEEFLTLPKAEASYFCNEQGIGIVREFLKQYFLIYDSENRQPLLDAYHEHAILSLSIPLTNQNGRLTSYRQINHNLLRSTDKDGRLRTVKIGKLQAVSFLTELPKTQHDLYSFSVDLSLLTTNLIVFTVAGIFKELVSQHSSSHHNYNILHFQRMFIIVPGVTGGFCIRNEMILITYATYLQQEVAFKSKTESNQVSNQVNNQVNNQISQLENSLESKIAAISVLPGDNEKQQIIQALSQKTRMNMDWSRKCLEETSWNLENATFIFEKLFKENKIPPEAFA